MPKVLPKKQRKGEQMKIIHIMADGSTRESIEGIAIQNEEFYRVLNGILEKRGVENQAR